jgi:HAD superfamily hydrolase (TIGR01450 family)
MKAIILGAGVGSRLIEITARKPKLLATINNKPLLHHAYDALKSSGIDDIILCLGYRNNDIIDYCNQKNLKVRFVLNTDFKSTNNMYSLYLAREHILGDFLLLNGDVIFDDDIIKGLVSRSGTLVAVDKGKYYEESMKIKVKDNRITAISKTILPEDAYGTSIDIYKISRDHVESLLKELERQVRSDRNRWTEVLLDTLFKSDMDAAPFDIGKSRWYEIDNMQDLMYAETLFNPVLPKLKEKKIFFLDVDGTLAIGQKKIEGADRIINSAKKFYIMTNNSSKDRQEHYAKLISMGLNVTPENILVSLDAAITFLKGKKVYWLANETVDETLKNELVGSEEPEALLLTYDNSMTYDKMIKFISYVRKGIPYYATHEDMVCPTPEGPIPDIGCFIEMIKRSTGRTPDATFGKPSKLMIEDVLVKHRLSLEDAVIIGDRLYTDIKMAEGSPLTSVLVLTGETSRADYEFSEIKADVVISDLNQIPL